MKTTILTESVIREIQDCPVDAMSGASYKGIDLGRLWAAWTPPAGHAKSFDGPCNVEATIRKYNAPLTVTPGFGDILRHAGVSMRNVEIGHYE